MSDSTEIKQEALERLIQGADIMQDAVDHEVRVAFGWMHTKDWQQVSPQLRERFLNLLRTAYRDGYHNGFCDRDDSAQKTQGEWVSAVLRGALVRPPEEAP
jgi:hypothetical protein